MEQDLIRTLCALVGSIDFRGGRVAEVLTQKNWVWMCGRKFQLPPNSKTTDEPNLQHILKPNFLFYPPINKL